jgi:hypothetical protein
VLLAAGVGRRFGGLKQLEPVGPGGETMCEYTIFDAWRAGVRRVVLVVREETETEFRATLGRRVGAAVEVGYVHQRLDDLPAGAKPPPGRTRPWGTGHAVLAARRAVAGAFIVANADDFYGKEAVEAVAAHAVRGAQAGGLPTYALAGFPLERTLPERGAVSRAVSECDAEGWLVRIEELVGIERTAGGIAGFDAAGRMRRIAHAGQMVSMNLWTLAPDFMDILDREFATFIQQNGDSSEAEFYLPAAVQRAIDARAARVRVLRAGADWAGLTQRADRGAVVARLAELTARGVYPAPLWTGSGAR